MPKCCICGKELQRPSLWACADCFIQHELALSTDDWPDWARAELRREKRRRRFKPSYGVSSAELSYAPYRRQVENKTYRKANHVRKKGGRTGVRVNADDIFYSTGDRGTSDGSNSAYHLVLESMPEHLRERLLQRAELKVILSDAVRSLPLISQRALRGHLAGWTDGDIADSERISVAMVSWLLQTAKERLADILAAKVGADDGTRFV